MLQESNWLAGEHPDISAISAPSEEDLLEALDAGLATTWEELRLFRFETWWRSNDPFRDRIRNNLPVATPQYTAAARTNMKDLYADLEPVTPSDRLLKIELFRELGFLSEAAELLREPFPEALAWQAAELRRLVACGNTTVALLKHS